MKTLTNETNEHRDLVFRLRILEAIINHSKVHGTYKGEIIRKDLILDDLRSLKELADEIENILQPKTKSDK